jgi:hypothetical protein
MGSIAAILHTPWDCKWSRFARRSTGPQTRGGLWDCVHSGARTPIAEADCETCPYWDFQSPLEGSDDRTLACERSAAIERSTRALEFGVRLSLFGLAALFAFCGLIVLTQPLAVPLTISLWIGAVVSLMLGIWGNFRSYADGSFRGFLPDRL